jgi:hypothetical protein
MDLSFLAPAFSATPVLSLTLDTGKPDESGARELELRWRALAEEVASAGAPASAVDLVDQQVRPLLEGTAPAGLVVVASADQVLLVHELHEPPTRDTVAWAPFPRLAEVVRQGARSVAHLVVTVDRLGGVVRRYGPRGEELVSIGETGESWPLTKVNAGGWAMDKHQRATEQKWEDNVAALAGDVNRIAAGFRPDLIVLAGDVRARGLFREHLQGDVAGLVRELDHPGDDEPTPEVVAEQVLAVAAEATTRVLDEARRGLGQGSDAAGGLPAVCRALQRRQVAALVIGDNLLDDSGREVWVGDTPSDVAADGRDVASGEPQRRTAADALVHAAVDNAADVVVAADGALGEADCVAVLRYSDASTDNR